MMIITWLELKALVHAVSRSSNSEEKDIILTHGLNIDILSTHSLYLP